MANILLLYSTTDGHTLEICERLRDIVSAAGHDVTLLPVADSYNANLSAYARIVIGASIRYGKHQQEVYDFINSNVTSLQAGPNIFFSVNLVARKPAKNRADTNPYVRKFLGQIPWQPQHVEIFAGKLDYPRYSFWDRNIIRLIMWITKGPTDPSTVKDFTDWNQVGKLGRLIADT